jgi:crossover junction endodeoxyribonuclease RuvC
MIVLGIDPGIAATGYGVIETTSSVRLVEYGCISTPGGRSLVERLQDIYQGIRRLVETFCPDEVAVEDIFFSRNAKTALSVAHARGVILLAASQKGARVFSYTPLEVKQAIAGYGRAHKTQVQHMVKTILCLQEIPRPDDAADAIAVGLCHWYSRRLKSF